MALYEVRRDPRFEIVSLLTTITAAYDRISMHGVRRSLLERQAEVLGLPLHQVRIEACCSNDEYETKMAAALAKFQKKGISRVAFGDIFLQDLRDYRERNLARAGLGGLFPIWKRDTTQLMNEFIALGFRAIVVSLDPRKLSASLVGRLLDASFLRDLPPEVDVCGENGEFHSFVFDGPNFSKPVQFEKGEVVERGGFVFCDLIPLEIAKTSNVGNVMEELC